MDKKIKIGKTSHDQEKWKAIDLSEAGEKAALNTDHENIKANRNLSALKLITLKQK